MHNIHIYKGNIFSFFNIINQFNFFILKIFIAAKKEIFFEEKLLLIANYSAHLLIRNIKTIKERFIYLLIFMPFLTAVKKFKKNFEKKHTVTMPTIFNKKRFDLFLNDLSFD